VPKIVESCRSFIIGAELSRWSLVSVCSARQVKSLEGSLVTEFVMNSHIMDQADIIM
jgi:hypothetical protein